jgi:hypothetical protein
MCGYIEVKVLTALQIGEAEAPDFKQGNRGPYLSLEIRRVPTAQRRMLSGEAVGTLTGSRPGLKPYAVTRRASTGSTV